jgi:signal transduction histidine kinase/putative methionine-R-sulfoxide reductase with GAF domain
MRRRDKAGGKAAKTQRRKTLKRRNAPEATPGHKSSPTDANEKIALLERRLTEALEQQAATSDVLKVISKSRGQLEPVFAAMLANATRICEAAYGAMWLREDGKLRNVAFHGDLPAAFYKLWKAGSEISLDSNVPIARAVRSGKAVVTPDLKDDPGYREGHPLQVGAVDLGGIRTLIAVPMVKEGEHVGGITIYRREVRPFTDKQIELVQNFAAQAVIAIENTRLLNELRQRTDDLTESLEQQTATSEVLRVISSSPTNVQPVFDAIAESAVRLCDGQFSFVMRFDGKLVDFASYCGLTAEGLKAFRSILPMPASEDTAAGRAIVRRAVVEISDVGADPSYGARGRGLAKAVAYRSIAAVPLLHEGNPIGAIAVARANAGPFPKRQIVLLQAFADQAVIAIENVRLFDEVQARTLELAKSLEDLRTTQDRLVQTQKLALLGQLTAGIAHEIKNPLNFVNNFSGISAELIDELQDTLNGMPLDDKARTQINELTNMLKGNFDKVVHHGKRADAIVKNMLQHSREGSGEHRVIDINALVEESLNLAWHGARAETQGFEIKLKQSFDSSAGRADVFPQDIRRALLNMISNGFYAANKRRAETNGSDYEPTLTASTKNLGDRVEIRIRDNGTGMPPDVKEKMFNPFFTTKPTGEGTGLGLSISHDIIVKQHGGSIEVDSQPGEFTEIRVILPRVAALLPERS